MPGTSQAPSSRWSDPVLALLLLVLVLGGTFLAAFGAYLWQGLGAALLVCGLCLFYVGMRVDL